MFTAREVAELRAYVSRHPIDDESNHHVPAAGLAALYLNANRKEGAPAIPLSDFLVFRPYDEEDGEDELDASIIDFFKDR